MSDTGAFFAATALVAYWATAFACLVICGMKGKYGMMLLALLFGPIPWFIGACRLARPDSYWARKHYDESKLSVAREPGVSPRKSLRACDFAANYR